MLTSKNRRGRLQYVGPQHGILPAPQQGGLGRPEGRIDLFTFLHLNRVFYLTAGAEMTWTIIDRSWARLWPCFQSWLLFQRSHHKSNLFGEEKGTREKAFIFCGILIKNWGFYAARKAVLESNWQEKWGARAICTEDSSGYYRMLKAEVIRPNDWGASTSEFSIQPENSGNLSRQLTSVQAMGSSLTLRNPENLPGTSQRWFLSLLLAITGRWPLEQDWSPEFRS